MPRRTSRPRDLLGRLGRQVRLRVRPRSPSSVGYVVTPPPAREEGRAGRPAGPRPSAAARLSMRRVPPNAASLERRDEVPGWIRKYGLISWLLIGMVIVVAMIVFATSRIQAVFIAVFLALVVTSVLDPIVTWLARYMPRGVATFLSLLGGFLVLAGLLTYVIASVAGQWNDLADQFSDGLEQIFDLLENGPLPFEITEAELYRWFNGGVAQITEYVQENAGSLAGQVGTTVGNVALIFTILALSLFITIFFLASGARMWRWCLDQLPAGQRQRVHLAASAGWYTFSGYARGTMIVALADAVMAFILLTVVGVPLAAPLSVLVMIGAFVPLIGAPLAMIVAAVVALAANGLVSALIVLVGIALIGQIEGHVLEPLVMGRQVSLHPVVVALGVISGTFLAGLLGAIIAIPLLAVIWSVYAALHQPADGAPPVGARRRRP